PLRAQALAMSESVRIDKWLWAVRLCKTRSLAAKQCAAGKVKREGVSLKAAAKIQIGERLEVPAADETHKRLIEVRALLEKRVGAPIAREAYTDHTAEEVLAEAQRRRDDAKQARATRKEGDQGRLTKKQRRQWRKQIRFFGDES
ncbi:MAG: RNA-binding S4 domain-containing protein, partial [Verrucomicrobiales bacterium]